MNDTALVSVVLELWVLPHGITVWTLRPNEPERNILVSLLCVLLVFVFHINVIIELSGVLVVNVVYQFYSKLNYAYLHQIWKTSN